MIKKRRRIIAILLIFTMALNLLHIGTVNATSLSEKSIEITGLSSLHTFNESGITYPHDGKKDLAKGKTVIVSSEHNANLSWNKITDGNLYSGGSGTDTNRWAPRGYGVNDLLEGYGNIRQGTGDLGRWEFAAVDLGSKQTLDEIFVYLSELPGAYRVYLWDGENPKKPDGSAFTGSINGDYTPSFNITNNIATARYKNTYFHQFLPTNFKITQEEIDAGKTFENAGFTLVRDFSYSLTNKVETQRADRIKLETPMEARYIIYEQIRTHNNLGTFGGSIRGIAAYAPKDENSITVTSPINNANKLLNLNADNTFDISGTYALENAGALSLHVKAKGADFNTGIEKEETVTITNLNFKSDGTWTGTVPSLDIFGNLTLEIELLKDGNKVAETSISNLIYRGKHNLACEKDARAIAVASHLEYPVSRLNDGVFAPGDNKTRWSVGGLVDGVSATDVWIGIDLGKDKEFDRVILTEWQTRTTGYVVEYAADADITTDPNDNRTLDATNWTIAKTGTTIGVNKVIDFSQTVKARYVRVRTTAHSQAQPGFTEFEVYKADSPIIDADSLAAPVIPNGNNGKVTLPAISNGEISLYGSDNKQIIDMQGNFYRPLVDMSVNVMYEAKVTSNGKVSCSEKDVNVVVPGRYSDNGVNPVPDVVPGIREWYGSATGGNFVLTNNTKIAASGSDTAKNVVGKTKEFFLDMLGVDLKNTSVAGNNDIEMILDTNLLPELGNEGCYLTIGDKLTISAGSETGLLYGGVTATQIFNASKDKRTAPKGEARDYPKYEVRAGMIDIARTYFPLDYLEEVGRYMAWFKLNSLQVHLNDGWDNTGFASFRLESDTYPLIKYNGNSANPGGANEGFYTKDEYRQFQKNLLEYGVEVINEIDTPAHSMIFGRLAPEEGRPPMRTGAHMNIDSEENRKSVEEFVLNLVDEYTSGDDPVFINKTVHFGGDEYSGSQDALASYNMEMTKALREKGLDVRMWSSGATLSSNVDSDIISDPNVMINIWHPAELSSNGGVKAAYEKGYNVINTCNFLYIDPANYNGYPDRYGGVYYQDSSNPSDYTFEHIYDVFNVNNTYTPRRGNAGSALMPLAHPQTKGAQMVLWNDIASYNGGISEFDIFDRFKDGVMMVAEKAWYGEQTEGQTWESFKQRIDKQWNRAPGANPARFVESIGDIIAEYDFNNEVTPLNDKSPNGYNATVQGTAQLDNSGIKLPDGTSVKLPFDSIGFPYSVNLKAKLDDVPANTILFDGKDGTLYANFNGTGNIGYVRGEFGLEYHFEYKSLTTDIIGTQTQPIKLEPARIEMVPQNLIEKNKWFDLTLVCEKTYPVHSNTSSQFRGVASWTDVALYINGQRIVGRATNVWINNDKEFKNSGSVGKRSNVVYDSTSFILPTEKILPDKEAVINNLKIYNRDLSEVEVKQLYQTNALVEFESNGGSNIKSIKPGVGKTFEAPANPIKSGYTFMGWYKDSGLNEEWDFNHDTINNDIILYAKWEKVQLSLDVLKELVSKANELDSKLYTKDSFDKVMELLEKAQKLLDKATQEPGSVKQEDIDDIYNELNTAIHNLVLIENNDINKIALSIALDMAKEVTQEQLDKVVPVVANEFKAALQNAQDVFDNVKASQEEVDNAFNRLARVMQMLEFYKGDKAALQKMMDQIASLSANDYTDSTWNALQAVLPGVNEVLGNVNAMQEEVDEVYTELVKALVNLRLKPNKDLLADLINKANGLNRANYTVASLKIVDEEAEKANIVLNDPEATKEQVTNAVNGLTKAMAGLEVNPTNPPVENTTNNPGNTVKPGDTAVKATKTGDELNVFIYVLGVLITAGYLYSKKKWIIK